MYGSGIWRIWQVVHLTFPLPSRYCKLCLYVSPQHFQFLQGRWSLPFGILVVLLCSFSVSAISVLRCGAANATWELSKVLHRDRTVACILLYCLLGTEDKSHHQLFSAAVYTPLSQPLSFCIFLIWGVLSRHGLNNCNKHRPLRCPGNDSDLGVWILHPFGKLQIEFTSPANWRLTAIPHGTV